MAVQCSADSFVVNQSLVLLINICGENRHLRQARKRYRQAYRNSKKKKNRIEFLILILSVILIFIIGVTYEIDYRILTRKSIKYFSETKIDYYGGKDFRIFETDIAFILTLIPISIFILTRKLALLKTRIKLFAIFLTCITTFYCLFCYLESCIIGITITRPNYIDGVLMYHHNNVNYCGILFLTIVSAFVVALITKNIGEKASL